jgi:hypothetical protein
VTLTKHELAGSGRNGSCQTGPVFQYRISGLPPGEYALIAEFPEWGWRILRWNDQWHGNWTGNYLSADAALDALREEILVVP